MGYFISLTGDCSNNSSGSALITFTDVAPYTLSWDGNVFPTTAFTSSSIIYNGLSAGTYTFTYTSSTIPSVTVFGPYSFNVYSSTTAYIDVDYGPSCTNDNGQITVHIETDLGGSSANVSLYKDYVFQETKITSGQEISFFNLEEGMYYASVSGDTTCNCFTESVIIQSDTNVLDFDFYIVNNSSCSTNSGKIYVTGITGNSPYTYSWSQNIGYTGATTEVTGLTQGVYTLTIIDNNGCSLSKTAAIANASPMGLITYTLNQPTCFNSDGAVTFYLSGGTGPYYYLLSNGDSLVSYSSTVTFSGLSANLYNLSVTDAALCTYTTSATLQTPKTFTFISSNVTNSKCQYNGGSVDIELLGGTPPFYYLLNNNSGTTYNTVSQLPSVSFFDLESGTYGLTIYDSSSACTYTSSINILNETSFNFTLSAQSTYCTSNSGAIQVDVVPTTTASTFYTYSLSSGFSSPPTTATTYVFNNLLPNTYTVTVSDATGCTQSDSVVVDYSPPYSFVLYGTDCGSGSGGTINAIINEEDGPFNLIWSSNVNGQTGINITGLTAGTYSLTVSGTSNCQTTKYHTISCNPPRVASSKYSYSVGTKSYLPSTFLNFSNMLSKGYISLTTGHDDCKMNYARFFCDIELAGTVYSGSFYTSKTLTQVPTLSAFSTSLNYLLSTIPDIKDYEVNLDTNTINVESDVVGGVEIYKDEILTITVRIVYKISCRT